MKINSKTLLQAHLIWLLASATPLIYSQDTTTARQVQPFTSSNSVSEAVRTARDALFERLMKHVRPMTAEPAGAPPRITSYHHNANLDPEMPIDLADTVVVGEISQISPHLLASEKGVYTEYRVTLTSILENTPAITLAPSGQIDLVELGGAGVLANGRTLRHVTKERGEQLEVGRRYLMFLNYEVPAQCYRIVKVWELRNGRLVATDYQDQLRVQAGVSVFNGSDEATALAAVKSAIEKKH